MTCKQWVCLAHKGKLPLGPLCRTRHYWREPGPTKTGRPMFVAPSKGSQGGTTRKAALKNTERKRELQEKNRTRRAKRNP